MNILIVDDESFVRRSLTEMLSQTDNGNWHVIASVENGLEAVEVIKQQPVDLVISDIRMPGMDGLELAQYIYEHYPDIETVLLTGYQDFHYARQAIRHGVCEYLVKPTPVDSILEIAGKVASRLELKQQKERLEHIREKDLLEKRLYDLIYGIPLPYFDESLVPSFDAYRILTVSLQQETLPAGWTEQTLYTAVINILEECFAPSANTVGIQEEQEAILLLFHTREKPAVQEDTIVAEALEKLSGILKAPFCAGLSDHHTPLGELPAAYRESLEACRSAKKNPRKQLVEYADISMLSASPQLDEHLKVKAKRRVISLMIEAMENRLKENLSLKMIADELYMNPTYLGRVFKEDIGEGFSSFLTKLRIKKATQLLNDVTLKVYEVSEQVGFKDPAYFSLLFKKYTGSTPQEYQKHNK